MYSEVGFDDFWSCIMNDGFLCNDLVTELTRYQFSGSPCCSILLNT